MASMISICPNCKYDRLIHDNIKEMCMNPQKINNILMNKHSSTGVLVC